MKKKAIFLLFTFEKQAMPHRQRANQAQPQFCSFEYCVWPLLGCEATPAQSAFKLDSSALLIHHVFKHFIFMKAKLQSQCFMLQGGLSDVAPTVLTLMGLSIPPSMKGAFQLL